MTEREWLTGDDPAAMFALVNGRRKVARLLCALLARDSARPSAEFAAAIDMGERWADGHLSDDEMLAVCRTVYAGVTAIPDPAESLAYLIRSGRDLTAHVPGLLREMFGNPFQPVTLDPSWLTGDVRLLARGIYDEGAFDRMPILADALQDAGCGDPGILDHCRQAGEHIRGCWVVDLLLGKP